MPWFRKTGTSASSAEGRKKTQDRFLAPTSPGSGRDRQALVKSEVGRLPRRRFCSLGCVSLWRAEPAAQLWFLAGASALLAYAAPGLPAPLNRWWTKSAGCCTLLSAPSFSEHFLLLHHPDRIADAAGRKYPMRRNFEPVARSYWIVREPPGRLNIQQNSEERMIDFLREFWGFCACARVLAVAGPPRHGDLRRADGVHPG